MRFKNRLLDLLLYTYRRAYVSVNYTKKIHFILRLQHSFMQTLHETYAILIYVTII